MIKEQDKFQAKPQAKQEKPRASRAKSVLIEVVTENGFSIARSCDDCESAPLGAFEHRFIVRHSEMPECAVVVEFSPPAIAAIQRQRRAPLSCGNSFWVSCAERALVTYLCERDHLPPGGRLLLAEMRPAELEIVRRWSHGLAPRIRLKPQTGLAIETSGRSFYLQSIIAILFLYVIAAFAPQSLASDLAYLRGLLSNLILYAAIFLSGALAGLAMNDLLPFRAALKLPVVSRVNIEGEIVLSAFDEQGRTPVERVIDKR